MIETIFSKKFYFYFFLIFLVFSVLPNKIQAVTDSSDYDFYCIRHGHNDSKDCGGQWQSFPRSNYNAAATSFQFLGHRHGGSSIRANACLVGSNGEGDCKWFSCSGDSCGKEYGGEHPWNRLDGGGITLSASGGSSNFRLFQSAQVMDAEVRVVGTATADYPDDGGGSCEPNSGNSCSKSNSCGTRKTNGTYNCDGICSAPTPPNDCSLLSCGPAGGNTCDQPGQNACNGFTAINSSDCSNAGQKCCFVPPPHGGGGGGGSGGNGGGGGGPPTSESVFISCNSSYGSCNITSGQNAIIRATWQNSTRCKGINPNGVDSWTWAAAGFSDLSGENEETVTPRVRSRYRVSCEDKNSTTANEIWKNAEVWVNFDCHFTKKCQCILCS